MRLTLHIAIYTISAILYGLLLYGIERSQFIYLILLFVGLFLGYLLIVGKGVIQQEIKPFSRKIWLSMLIAAVGFRLIALFSMPNLSDDYFRFVWDGRLLASGVNPFLQKPSDYVKQPEKMVEYGLSQEIFEGLNSKEYFTIYPPVNQFIFWISSVFSQNSVEGAVGLMKLFLFLGELISLYLLYKLLQHYGRPREWLAFYALNPLVNVELVGNLHFEALMITFFAMGYLFIFQRKMAIVKHSLCACYL